MNNFKIWLESGQHKYAVVLYHMPELITRKVATFSKKQIPQSSLYLPEGGREEETHVTVLFGFQNKDLKEVQQKIKGTKPFQIQLGKITKFDNKNEYDVIKIDILGKDLVALNKKLKQISHYSSYNDYKPHCTLAYVKKDSCNKLIDNEFFVGTTVEINHVFFVDTNKKRIRINFS